MKITGEVGEGLGTGKYFISIPNYKRQMAKAFGWEPFEGTLNIYVKDMDIPILEKLKNNAPFVFSGFVKDGITFFRVRAHLARLAKYDYACAAIFPSDAHNVKNALQLVAPDCLRKKLRLKDGDLLEVEILK